MPRELPSSHRPWIFDEYYNKAQELAGQITRGVRDDEVIQALHVLSPRELDIVYHVMYDGFTVARASRLLLVEPATGRKYWASAKAKLALELEQTPVCFDVDAAQAAMSRLLS